MELYILSLLLLLKLFRNYQKREIFCKRLSISQSKKYFHEFLNTFYWVTSLRYITSYWYIAFPLSISKLTLLDDYVLKRNQGNIQYFKRISYYAMTVTIENPSYNEIDLLKKLNITVHDINESIPSSRFHHQSIMKYFFSNRKSFGPSNLFAERKNVQI